MAFVKLVIFGFIAMSIIYLSISLYSKSVRRERLEKRFDAENPGGDRAARDAYVTAGMERYNKSFRPKLIALVYIIPTVAVSVIIYIVNAN